MRQNQTEFYLERMQPEWLPNSRQHREYRIVSSLFAGLVVALVFGLVVALVFGGFACIQHFVLRWFLRSAGAMPWHYVPFLDYAADHLLLGKVGGGYIFIIGTNLRTQGPVGRATLEKLGGIGMFPALVHLAA